MKNAKFVFALLPIAGGLLAGCSNMGNENPISPEQMVEIRNKQMNDRGNFHPDTNSPGATSPGAGGASRPSGR